MYYIYVCLVSSMYITQSPQQQQKTNKWYSNSPCRSIRELRSQGKSHPCHWRHKGSTEEYLMAVNG